MWKAKSQEAYCNGVEEICIYIFFWGGGGGGGGGGERERRYVNRLLLGDGRHLPPLVSPRGTPTCQAWR